jgi:integrase
MLKSIYAEFSQTLLTPLLTPGNYWHMAFRKTTHPGITVYKRKSGALYARWRDPDTGGMQYQSLTEMGFTTKTKAKAWLDSKVEELETAKLELKVRRRLPALATDWQTIEDMYFEHFEAEYGGLAAERTRSDWFRRWRGFIASNQISTGGELTVRHLGSFRDSLGHESQGLAPATRNRTLGAVNAMLKWARLNGLIRIASEDRQAAMKPYRQSRPQPRVLSGDELRALVSALVKHDSVRFIASRANKAAYTHKNPGAPQGAARYAPLGPFVLLALLTGARPGEVLSLKWESVDFERSQIRIWGSKTLTERYIPMHDSHALRTLLQGMARGRGSDIHVCGDWADGKPTEIHDRQWKRLIELAGLQPFPIKVLRSTCIAHVASASTDSEYLLQARFGHGTGVSKRHYRQPIHGLKERGDTVEQWLGVETELQVAIETLGFGPDIDHGIA